MTGTVRKWSVLLTAVSFVLAGCGSDSATYSILPDSESFKQNTQVSTKIDILWVIDNSGSMKTSQDNVADNFESFITSFKDKNLDFQMAVTTTDAYLAGEEWNGGQVNWEWSQFRDGTDETSHTGVRVIRSNTPNLEETFLTNMLQGTKGYGDERHFQSMQMTLDNPLNADFVRDESFLAVIFITDEEDFSHDGRDFFEDYNHPDLHPVSDYVTYLDNATSSAGATRRYSVSTIAIPDEACLEKVGNEFKGRKIAHRVQELASLTGGVLGDICGNFASTLQNISSKIIELASQFYLDRQPIPDSITVFVDGKKVPRADQNANEDGGWYYNESANSVVFQGSAYIPPQGASIKVDFDPATLDF